MRVDLHNHTWLSPDGMMSPEKLIKLAKARGLDAIAVTDHNRLTHVKDPSITIILGEEIKTTKGEVIGLFLNEEIPRGLSPWEVFDLIRDQGGIIVVPHPFDIYRAKTALLFHIDPKDLPKDVLIEVKNGRYVCSCFEERARRFAETRELPQVGGSDAHTPVEVGRAWTEVPEFSDEEELFRHLKKGRTKPSGSYSPPWVHLTVPAIKVLHDLGVLPG